LRIRNLICCLVAAILLNGCATTDQRKPLARHTPPPPHPAAVLDPLPLSGKSQVILPDLPASPDSSAVFVKQVEDLYQTGMDDYRAGNLEKAREEFDQALATLLESGFDIRGDERLSSEFDKIVENVYAAEAATLERGDSLSPHNYEPAPIDSFSGLTFPVDPRVKQQAQQELKSVHSDLPLVSNEYVDGVLTYLQRHGRGYVDRVLKGLGKYGELISEALRKQGLPQDLIYLAAGESAFNPFAVSSKRCVGIWQFGLGTAELYGLKKDRWVDEREDPVKSTEAAARHLKELYQTFGDWFLVMAAYDSGPGTVQRAVERTGYADYWELRRIHALPTETENYVPVFIATALIAKDPKAYGFDTPPDPPLRPDRVTVRTPTDLRLVAELIDRPVQELVSLNPSLQRWTTPANSPAFVLNLPEGTKSLYEKTIASIPEGKRIWWRAHRVAEGETLADVAKQYRISPAVLANANQLDPGDSLAQGAHVVVPLAPGKDSSLARVRETTARTTKRVTYYRVRPGDTLDLIADRFDVTPYQIRRWNNMKSSQLASGKPLRIYAQAQETSSRPARRVSNKGRAKVTSAAASKKPNTRKAAATRKKSSTPRSRSTPAAALPAK